MKFEAGKSGNPNGRPQGSGHRQKLFETLVGPHKEQLFDKAIQLALDGNEAMLRLFLERMLPAKPKQEKFAINFTADNHSVNYLEDCGQEIIQTISEGNIEPDYAFSLIKVLGMQNKLIELGSLTKKVEDIQEALRLNHHR